MGLNLDKSFFTKAWKAVIVLCVGSKSNCLDHKGVAGQQRVMVARDP